MMSSSTRPCHPVHFFLWLTAATISPVLPSALGQETEQPKLMAGLRDALCFHASFDSGTKADFARGDAALYHAPSVDRRDQATPGLPDSGEMVLRAAPGGRAGRALQFTKAQAPLVFFKAEKNFPSPAAGWAGAVSFWLSVDPAADLAEGFCDPIQLTSKKWDDAAIFVEFEKRASGIPFRLGVYADTPVWNPQGRKWEEIPAAEKPLLAVPKPPFAKDAWTHVAVTIERFNTGKSEGVARLYLNGREVGKLGPRLQTFTWDAARSVVMIGVGYVGFMDDLAPYDRALTAEEIAFLHERKPDLAPLHPKSPETR